MKTRLSVGLLVLVLAVSAVRAQTPLGTAFTYQGRLESAGQPVNGTANLVFKLYDASAAGALLGTQTLNSMSVTDGLFTVVLNAAGEFGQSAFYGDRRWLEITVNGTPLAPRQELTAAPYALQTRGLYVDNFGRVGIGTTSPFTQLAIDGGLTLRDVLDEDVAFHTGNFYINHGDTAVPAYHYTSDPEQHEFFVGGALSLKIASNGNVGIGTANPTAALDVAGTARITANAAIAFDASNSSTAVSAMAIRAVESGLTGNTYGVFAVANSTSGIGVLGRAAAGSGATSGVYGQNLSTTGYGVYGLAQTTSGVNYGVYGRSASTDGRGVFGEATAVSGDNYGLRGESRSTSGRGVEGEATSATGQNYGVRGVTASTTGRGVLGWANASTGTSYGVWGQSNSTNGRGVYGLAGLDGVNYGVYGRSESSDGWSVWAQGRMGASGTKSFCIDHPDDPTNKYLLHYSAESPEVINFYSETVTLDERGEAVVELPHYFAKINTRPRYQLTAVGAPMPMLHVAAEIDEAALNTGAKAEPAEAAPTCSFRIAGGVPGAKVSWEVKAVRNDRWVQQHGAPVDVEKQDLERDTYQHPELYGQPPKKGMNNDAGHERPDSDRPSRAPEAAPR